MIILVFAALIFPACKKDSVKNSGDEPTPAVSFGPKVDTSLVTPGSMVETQRLYQFLKKNFGYKTLSSVTLTIGTTTELDYLKTQTGKQPAMAGTDFMDSGRGYNWFNDNWPINEAKAYWDQNGIPTIMWHWRDPSRKTEEFYANATPFDVSKIDDPASYEYKAIISDIDYVSGLLKVLQNEHVPVIWRPLHEGANGSFWWGAKGPGPYRKLFQLMYDRMVNYNGLKNLIWVYTTEPNDADWYPGDQYVDIVGRDMYTSGDHSSQSAEFNRIYALYGGKKMVAYTEAGSIPDPDNLQRDGAAWAWVNIWSGDYVTGTTWNSLDLWKKTLASDYVITLDKMPSLKN